MKHGDMPIITSAFQLAVVGLDVIPILIRMLRAAWAAERLLHRALDDACCWTSTCHDAEAGTLRKSPSAPYHC
jgi:hypothetical protein